MTEKKIPIGDAQKITFAKLEFFAISTFARIEKQG